MMKDLERRVVDLEAAKPNTRKNTWEGSLAMARLFLEVVNPAYTEEELLSETRRLYSAPPFDPTKHKLSPELLALIDSVVNGE